MAGKVRMRDVLQPRKTILDYTYDFGDQWDHRLTVTDIRAGEPGISYPRYIGGERNGPPRARRDVTTKTASTSAFLQPVHPTPCSYNI